MKIYITSVFVDDQAKAEKFYCDILGFKIKDDIPMGDFRWLTVSQTGAEGETELLLEPSAHPAVGPYRDALMADGIPLASFLVDNLDAEHRRLASAGVEFAQGVTDMGNVRMAILNDTCGNLIQLVQKRTVPED
ncbi:VOC family protein [Roseibium sp. SCP14]|uniref:VOC family protein n=1 Tax=Roseibium sp. SCP14 TaxID=3141375 RepID=UPI00333B660B